MFQKSVFQRPANSIWFNLFPFLVGIYVNENIWLFNFSAKKRYPTVFMVICIALLLVPTMHPYFNFQMCFLVETLLIGCLLLAVVNMPKENIISKILKSNAILRLGKISYSFYLFQLPVIFIVTVCIIILTENAFLLRFYFVYSCLIAISTCMITYWIADKSYRYVEQPMIEIGRTITQKYLNYSKGQ